MPTYKWLLFSLCVTIVTPIPMEQINEISRHKKQPVIIRDNTANDPTLIIESATPSDTETSTNSKDEEKNLFKIMYSGMTSMFTHSMQIIFVLIGNYISKNNSIQEVYKNVVINKRLKELEETLNFGHTELKSSEELYVKLNYNRDVYAKASAQDILIAQTLDQQLQDLQRVMETGSRNVDERMAALLASEESSKEPPSNVQHVFESAVSEFETRFKKSIQNIKRTMQIILVRCGESSNKIIDFINRKNINQEGIDYNFENVKTATLLNKSLTENNVRDFHATSEQIDIGQSDGRSESSEKHDHHSKPSGNNANAALIATAVTSTIQQIATLITTLQTTGTALIDAIGTNVQIVTESWAFIFLSYIRKK